MIKVRVTRGIADEYAKRGRFPVITGPGDFIVSIEDAEEMLADAEWYGGPDGPDEVESWLPRIYRQHAARIRAAKETK